MNFFWIILRVVKIKMEKFKPTADQGLIIGEKVLQINGFQYPF